jgi:amino acid efflux transporter
MLRKELSTANIISLYISSVLGSGILILPGLAADIAGAGSLFSWSLMAFLSFPLSYFLARLSCEFPRAGGVATFCGKAFNQKLEGVIELMWVFATGIGIPALIVVGANYFHIASGLPAIIAAFGLLFICVLINLLGVRISARVQGISQIVLISILLLTGILGISKIDAFPLLDLELLPILTASAVIFWAFLGWENVTFASEEAKDTSSYLKGLFISVLVINVVYLTLALAVVGNMDKNISIIRAPIAGLMKYLAGNTAGVAVGYMGFFIVFMSALAYTLGSSRLVYSASRRGAFPRLFASTNDHGVPQNSFLGLSVVWALAIYLILSFDLNLSLVIRLANSNFLFIYIATMIAAYRLLKIKLAGRIALLVSTGICVIFFIANGQAILYTVLTTLIWIALNLRKF